MTSEEMLLLDVKNPAWTWALHAFFATNLAYVRIFYGHYGTDIAVYAMVLFAMSALLAWMGEWEHYTLWVHVYACVLAQIICDSVPILLPQGFVLYAAIPLLLLGVGEVVVVATMATPAYRDYAARVPSHTWRAENAPRSPRLVRWVYGICSEKELRRWYPVLFEVYMTLCSCALALRGSFMRAPCIAAVYVTLVGLVFLTADALRDERLANESHLVLPSPAVKAVYVLFAPARFMQPILLLAAVTLLVGGSQYHAATNRAIAIIVLGVTIAASVMHRDIDACPV